MIGGGVGFVGHISICDGVTISGMTFVTKSIRKPGTYTSGFPALPHAEWLKNAVHLRRLHTLASRIPGTSGEDLDHNDD
jgi:UDP-3-O-[3-hydroxymyristoyl] glucosamine N-acyltransferase